MNKEVNLTKRVRTPDGPRYCPVVLSANGRVKPDWVLVDGREERHPEGSYYIEWYEGSKRIRRSVGKDAASASAQRHRQEQMLASKNAGIKVIDEPGDGTLLADAVNTYLDNIKLTRKPKTNAAYRATLDHFLESCRKQKLEDVDRHDLLQFAAHLRDREKLAPRTVANKFGLVVSFLKASGRTGIVQRGDWPRYTEDEPEIYEREDLDKFFNACDNDERALFEFFLMTGMREQEVQHAEWTDVNLSRGVVTVRYKPEYGFSPKTYKGREIPIANKLVSALKRWKLRSNGSSLIFPAKNGSPDGHFLRYCKRIAKRAGLNESDWWLHKFRSTFATTALRSGVDLRTVQSWMGHTDLQSTMRYLKPARSHAVRSKLNEMFD